MFKSFLPLGAGLAAIAAFVSAPVSAPVLAHHSAIQFDFTKSADMVGIVKVLKVVNPHTELVLTIKDKNGASHNVVFEGHSRNNFYRGGWRPTSIKFGDRIKVTYAPMRNGSLGGFVNQLETESGKKIGMGF